MHIEEAEPTTTNLFLYPLGLWSSPIIGGKSPLPCSRSTLTMIDDHRAVLFGGYLGRELGVTDDVFIIDLSRMVSSFDLI